VNAGNVFKRYVLPAAINLGISIGGWHDFRQTLVTRYYAVDCQRSWFLRPPDIHAPSLSTCPRLSRMSTNLRHWVAQDPLPRLAETPIQRRAQGCNKAAKFQPAPGRRTLPRSSRRWTLTYGSATEERRHPSS
jgi:hypothetical protein